MEVSITTKRLDDTRAYSVSMCITYHTAGERHTRYAVEEVPEEAIFTEGVFRHVLSVMTDELVELTRRSRRDGHVTKTSRSIP